MHERKNIFAYTDPQWPMPSYVSVNTEDDNVVSITVRTAGVDKPAVTYVSHSCLRKMHEALGDFLSIVESKSTQA